MATKEQVVSVARSYVGTKFHHLGRVKNVGVDCVGIILGVADELNINLTIHPEFERYGRRSRQRPLLEYMDEQFAWIKEKEIGSIFVSWFDSKTKNPSHLGIVTDKGLIHTSGRLGIVIEEHWNDDWNKYIVAYYKYPGVK